MHQLLCPLSMRRLLGQTHPEIDAHGGDEAAGQEGGVFETDQQAGLPHAGVPDQHHLRGGQKESGENTSERLL